MTLMELARKAILEPGLHRKKVGEENSWEKATQIQ
jgi:hypothetical protein